jgi:hypothetical protein
MKTTLQLQQRPNGQFRYRIVLVDDDGSVSVRVDWEFGPFNREEAIAQAKERFSFDSIQAL